MCHRLGTRSLAVGCRYPELLGTPSPCHQATWGSQTPLSWAPGCPHICADFHTLGVATAVPAWAGFPGWPGGGQHWPFPPAGRARRQLILRGRCLDKMRWESWRLPAAHIWLGFALYASDPLSSALPLLSRNRVSASGQRDLGAKEVKVPGRDGCCLDQAPSSCAFFPEDFFLLLLRQVCSSPDLARGRLRRREML